MHWKDFPLNMQVHKPLDIQDSFPLLNTERQDSCPSPSVNITVTKIKENTICAMEFSVRKCNDGDYL